MPSKKKEEVVSVFVCHGKAEEDKKKSFNSDWAEKLAAEGVERAATHRVRPVGFHIHINIKCKPIKNYG